MYAIPSLAWIVTRYGRYLNCGFPSMIPYLETLGLVRDAVVYCRPETLPF